MGAVGTDDAGLTATLLESTYAKAPDFDKLRLLRTAAGLFVVVRAATSGKIKLVVDADYGGSKWSPGPFSVLAPSLLGDGKDELDLRSTGAWRVPGRVFSLPRTGAAAHAKSSSPDSSREVWLAGDAALAVRSSVAKGKGLEKKTWAVRVDATDTNGASSKPLMHVRHDGATGIASAATDGYGLTIGGNVHIKGNAIDQAKSVGFVGKDRIAAHTAHGYIQFASASAGSGGIYFADSTGSTMGGVVQDGQLKNSSFGLVDSKRKWAVRIRESDYVRFYVAGQARLTVKDKGVGVLTEPAQDTALTVKGDVAVKGRISVGSTTDTLSGYLAWGGANTGRHVGLQNTIGQFGVVVGLSDSRLLAKGKERIRVDGDGTNITGTLRSNRRVHRDFAHFATSDSADKGQHTFHMCTNIPMNGTMFVIEARGYSYQNSKAIHATWAGYARAPTKKIERIHTRDYTGALSALDVYKSKDGLVCIRASALTWYIGMSFSAWTVNPHGVHPFQATGFNVKAVKSKLVKGSIGGF